MSDENTSEQTTTPTAPRTVPAQTTSPHPTSGNSSAPSAPQQRSTAPTIPAQRQPTPHEIASPDARPRPHPATITVGAALVGVLAYGVLANPANLPTVSLASPGTTADRPLPQPTPAPPGSVDPSQVTAAAWGASIAPLKTQVTPTQLRTGVARVGTDAYGVDARGEFWIIDIDLRNDARYVATADDLRFSLVSATGDTVAADTLAEVYVDASFRLAELDPGETGTGVIIFDVPTTFTPAYLMATDDRADEPTFVRLPATGP